MTNHTMNEKAHSTVVLRGVTRQSLPAMVRECLEHCDWQQLVPRGSTVVLKPNLCTAIPEKIEMSNTDAALTAAVCEVLFERAGRIVIGESDGLRQTADEAFAASGYEAVAKRLNVELVNFSKSPWRRVQCSPPGDVELPALLLDADVFITLPVLKTHALTYFTGALKNQWGCVPRYDRILLHKHLDPMLCSLHRLLRPALTVMDGIVGMEGRGPANGKARRLDLILAGQDALAVDAAAARLVGLEPERSRHLVMAAQQGLGRMTASEIVVDGDGQRHATQFEPAILDWAIASMNYMTRYRWFVRNCLESNRVFYPVRSLVQVLRRVGVVAGG